MRGLRRFVSIRNTMILSFMVLISVVVLCLSLASYYFTINDFESLSISNTALLLGEINFSIDTYIENMKSMAEVVARNEDVGRLLSFYSRSYNKTLGADELAELETLRQRASRHMEIVANTRGDITNIALISKYGDVVFSDMNKKLNKHSDYNLAEWFLRPLTHKDDIFVSPSHVQNLIDGEYRWVISISKALVDPDSSEVTGTMVIDLNYRAIESICENINLEQVGYIYLTDTQHNLIYHPQQQLIYSGIKSEDYDAVAQIPEGGDHVRTESGDRIYIRDVSETTGWIAVGVINTHQLIGNRAAIVRFYIVLAYIAIVVAGAVAIQIAGAITKPIKTLENTMRQVELGDFTVWSDVGLHNEIGHLSNTFNAMISQIRKLMDDLVKNESEKRLSEIRSLQAQINPHFLYNTLDTIIWMSASGKNHEVVEVTSALAHLFRTSVSQGDSLVELDVEMKNIESYLTIQKMRYKDKLSYGIEISPQTRSLMTPKLILQPIVENAIYHGIKQCEGGGEVTIRSEMRDDELVITVGDSGVGMSEKQLSDILKPREGDEERGIGVLNVHERIKLVFGAEYGLEYQSAEGHGTLVTIRMPAVEKNLR